MLEWFEPSATAPTPGRKAPSSSPPTKKPRPSAAWISPPSKPLAASNARVLRSYRLIRSRRQRSRSPHFGVHALSASLVMASSKQPRDPSDRRKNSSSSRHDPYD